ncbi:hypothetical protein PVAG01_07881 [Phlyctema vagabunda]|uniref:Uncharacterized protein n=1 Tax=Phlyctema vagabunda TaxID=108571 RepID=A0ABR4PDN7_9HELO
MDNGPLQKEQALRIKRMVGQNNNRRRKRRILDSTSLPFPGMDVMDNKSLDISAASVDNSAVEVLLDVSAFDETAPGDWSQLDSWSTDLDMSSIVPGVKTLSTDLTFDQLGWDNDLSIRDGSFDGHDPILSETSRLSQYSDSVLSPLMNMSTMQTSEEIADTIFQDELQRGVTVSSITKPPSIKYSTQEQPPRAVEAMLEPTILLTDLEDAVFQNEIEDNLFMHYLDEVFHLQFPFYNTPNRRPRGWLFSTVKRTKSVYHATLALSQYLLRCTAEASLSPKLSSKRDHHEMAHRELEASREESKEASTLSRITCILQILFHEQLFTGGTGNWQQHLCVAGPLIPPLVQSVAKSAGATSSGVDYGIKQQQQKYEESSMESRDDMEMQVALGSFIWFDIMASASTRSAPSFKLDHQRILDIFRIKLECLFGCSNRVLELILDIVYLDSWKKEVEKTRQLSMIELVKRGAKIEENLRQYIEGLEVTSSLELRNDSRNMSAAQTEITRIFALSAQAYLHVVISGAHPELPEIADSVSKSIEAFESISDPCLLRHLVWPFCVTGCLATKAQQGFFRELVSRAGITCLTVGTCWQAFQIIEECWEIRKTCSYNCDWVFIMNKRSCNVLLA